MSRHRELKGYQKIIFRSFSLLALLAAIKHVFYINYYGTTIITSAYLKLLILFYLPIVFLLFPATKKSNEKVPWYDLVLAFVSILPPLYYVIYAEKALFEAWEFSSPTLGIVLSSIILFLLLEAGRRTVGWIFVIIIAFFCFYPLFAEQMPGILWGMGWSFPKLASYHFASQESIVGIPMMVLGNLLIGFMVFAAALQVTGSGKFFLDLSLSVAGRLRGAQAKVAILASAFFGSMSGSPVANVLTTGQFTIPAMKQGGYSPEYAGSVEACASTGGVLMPPIMGVAAFIMAEFLEISYAKVVIAALVPSLLYYLTLFIQVDAQAALKGLSGVSKDVKLPRARDTIKDGWFFIASFAVLVWMLLVAMKEAQAPFYALGTLFILLTLNKNTRVNINQIWSFIEGSGRIMAELTVILACVGLIVGSLTMTGVAHSISKELIGLAGGSKVFLLIFSALAAFVLGMGVPLAPAYIILAIIMIPALLEMGFNPIASHMFALYWANQSFITPPVCLSAFAAAGISGAPPMKTGFMSMRIGSVSFIVPFFFILNSSLILQGTWQSILWAIPTALAGAVCWAAGLEGYLLGLGKLSKVMRIVFLGSGLLLMIPDRITDIVSIGILVIASLSYKFIGRKRVAIKP